MLYKCFLYSSKRNGEFSVLAMLIICPQCIHNSKKYKKNFTYFHLQNLELNRVKCL